MNELLAQLRAAADSMHTTLVVWENHIDHPGARTAIHSAARALLDAASAMPTHYDDGSERIKQLELWLAAHDVEVRAQALREAASAPIPRAALNTRNNGLRQWLRARADRIERGE